MKGLAIKHGYGFVFTSLFLFMLILSCSKSQDLKGIFVDFQKTEKVKKDIKDKRSKYFPAYLKLIENAEKAMDEGFLSVMQKKRIPPGGDKHDYLSMGPYWWPDPDKRDGLPYIRRDGEVNPETRGDNVDQPAKSKLFTNVESLTWAFYFSGDKKYAEKAVSLLETWFINPETRMNPNLNYAQGIPGICDGRGIGIIDWSRIDMLISPVQILDAYGMLKPEIGSALFSWFDEYLNWLLNSQYGKDEDDYFNNHGTWYDVQAVSIALLLGKNEMAAERLEKVKSKRIETQIEPDGRQPKELARTKALSYSTMNLLGFTYLANLGQITGVELWNYESPEGRSIKKTYEFLFPYAGRIKTWEYDQIADPEGAIDNLKLNFRIAASRTGDPFYREFNEKYGCPQTDLKFLLYPVLK